MLKSVDIIFFPGVEVVFRRLVFDGSIHVAARAASRAVTKQITPDSTISTMDEVKSTRK